MTLGKSQGLELLRIICDIKKTCDGSSELIRIGADMMLWPMYMRLVWLRPLLLESFTGELHLVMAGHLKKTTKTLTNFNLSY